MSSFLILVWWRSCVRKSNILLCRIEVGCRRMRIFMSIYFSFWRERPFFLEIKKKNGVLVHKLSINKEKSTCTNYFISNCFHLYLGITVDQLYLESLGSSHGSKNLKKGTFLVRVRLKTFGRICDDLWWRTILKTSFDNSETKDWDYYLLLNMENIFITLETICQVIDFNLILILLSSSHIFLRLDNVI